MAFVLSNVRSVSIKALEEKLLGLSLQACMPLQTQIREKYQFRAPRLRNPTWFTKKTRMIADDWVTAENREFVQEAVTDRYAHTPVPTQNELEWTPDMRRTGVIARKIGVVPIWLKSGKKIMTTMLQILDNHVIKYYSPEEYDPPRDPIVPIRTKKACLLVGAEATDPTLLTKEYCGLFKGSGVMPKKHLARFFISSDAKLLPGTSINALHFTIGNYVDVYGKTIDRGFQGVMKRHGFSGMPASHGVTKTHRRPGNIGGGGEKGRVWPGTKLPGHMGNRWRILRGLKVWRTNTKHQVIWVSGQNLPGETNSICRIYDTLLPNRTPAKPLAFPTYFDKDDEELPEELYDEEVHRFSDPPLTFEEK